MGKPKLKWSPIQLKLANQCKIFPIERLEQVEVNLDGVRTVAYFKAIEIVDDTNPYPELMGIDWAFDNLTIINLRKRQMIFKEGDIRLITSLDPHYKEHYVKPVREDLDVECLNQLYNITTKWGC